MLQYIYTNMDQTRAIFCGPMWDQAYDALMCTQSKVVEDYECRLAVAFDEGWHFIIKLQYMNA